MLAPGTRSAGSSRHQRSGLAPLSLCWASRAILLCTQEHSATHGALSATTSQDMRGSASPQGEARRKCAAKPERSEGRGGRSTGEGRRSCGGGGAGPTDRRRRQCGAVLQKPYQAPNSPTRNTTSKAERVPGASTGVGSDSPVVYASPDCCCINSAWWWLRRAVNKSPSSPSMTRSRLCSVS